MNTLIYLGLLEPKINEMSKSKLLNLFMDCEMLCWPDKILPAGQSFDIIQIGIVEVDILDLKITREANYYIRPKNKKFEVSPYCVDLTRITKDKLISKGRPFKDICNVIAKDFGTKNKITYAWGDDNTAFKNECLANDAINPWENTGIWDMGSIFRGNFNIKSKMSLSRALEYLNIPFVGEPHCALNDARALAHLHIETIKRIRNG